MAKELTDQKFMEAYGKLDHKDQQKIIDKLDKEKKPKVPGAPEKEDTGATEGWK